MSDIYLSEQEVKELTGKQKESYQKRELDALGYEYRTRTDGSFVVPRAQFMHNAETPTKQKRPQMNVKAFRRGKAA